MKILHVLSTPRAEGTPNLVLDWLATGQYEQEVFVLNSEPAELTNKLRDAAQWYGEENYFSRGPRKFVDIAAGARRVCHQRRPNVLICWPTGFANWICLGARLAGVKKLLVHCGNPPDHRNRNGKWMTRYSIWPLEAFGAKCVCCSNYVRQEFRAVPGIPKGIFHVVWNCVRVNEVQRRSLIGRDRRRPLQNARLIAVMVATLEQHKDHETLLQAIPAIRERLPGFCLRLVGDGALMKRLKGLAASLHLDDNVEFLGTRADVPELLGESDLFVFSTTVQEGLGSVLIEALAAGLPILASDVPACREVLAGGRFGKLVPTGDRQAWVEAILDFVNSPRRLTGDNRNEYLENFKVERMMEKYLGLVSSSNRVRPESQ